ncbi:hypothetical protein CONLIGDRAFT_372461 [Coniochaeta ligniaria NRRL 30616]|uniref:Secreted protein n=1 Tax=Coniochaeta ligniaria NRRL 30616 TaxID=1408157 RepID=A0A1J7J4U4_9PEZI|nr:hypothetical protein CONLIGDRAFT_372461 [Coniochaeta ligniaria NRRL 30616]
MVPGHVTVPRGRVWNVLVSALLRSFLASSVPETAPGELKSPWWYTPRLSITTLTYWPSNDSRDNAMKAPGNKSTW